MNLSTEEYFRVSMDGLTERVVKSRQVNITLERVVKRIVGRYKGNQRVLEVLLFTPLSLMRSIEKASDCSLGKKL